ncbi:MAG: DNA repair protein RadC [Verrucomicrobiales bacterium]|nr:DNA repair protein RadC [Verrucomicrobiales bacterium]
MNPAEYPSNAELISSFAGKPAAELILQDHPTLTSLAHASFEDLQQYKGIGKSKAAAIRSAFLIAQRLSQESFPESPILDSPDRIAALMRDECRTFDTEQFHVVLLNTRRRLIRIKRLATGTLDTVHVHPREVFRLAITANAAAVVGVHNHPSGDPNPSEADIRVTRELIRAGQVLRIDFLDHVIIGLPTPARPQDFVSLRALGYFST